MEKSAFNMVSQFDTKVPLPRESSAVRSDDAALERMGLAPVKDIQKTLGGRITDIFINYVIGFVGNSSLSLGITYGLNPRPWVKDIKDGMRHQLLKVFKSSDPVKMESNIRSGIEIGFMFIAGIIATLVMTPLMKRRESIAYRLNQFMGRDKDVLPEHMKPVKTPETMEEKIEQEVIKRINKHHNGVDLWKARIVSMAGVILGDQLINRWSQAREEKSKPSVDTLAWAAGHKVYRGVPGIAQKLNNWFSKHGAGPEDIQANMKAHYGRLVKSERGPAGNSPPGSELNKDSMVIAEQTRLISKEWGWTLILSLFVDKLTYKFHSSRVKNETYLAVTQLREEGVIPEGYKVKVTGPGQVIVSCREDDPELARSWTDSTPALRSRPEKPVDRATAVKHSRENSDHMALV